eukprot:9441994-Alexandrium_andersonii.AAC.1
MSKPKAIFAHGVCRLDGPDLGSRAGAPLLGQRCDAAPGHDLRESPWPPGASNGIGQCGEVLDVGLASQEGAQ